jgi:hypothetical protein
VHDARLDAKRALGEVDVAPPQRDDLAAAQAGERGGQEDRGVLLVVGGTHQRPDLLRRVEVEARRVVVDLDPGHGGYRVALEPVQHGRPLVHRVQQGHQLRRLPPLAGPDQEVRLPALDARRRDLLDAQVSEGREQVATNAGAAVDQRRVTPAALVLAPDEPVLGELLEGHAGTKDLDVAAARVGEDRVERGLGAAAVVVAGRRRSLVGPLRPELLLDLSPARRRRRIGRAVLDDPDVALLVLAALDVAADVRHEGRRKHRHSS